MACQLQNSLKSTPSTFYVKILRTLSLTEYCNENNNDSVFFKKLSFYWCLLFFSATVKDDYKCLGVHRLVSVHLKIFDKFYHDI